MLKICGANECSQLIEKSNNLATSGLQCICPLITTDINVTKILSISVGCRHSVIITTDNKLLGIGDNTDGRIIGSLPKKIITKLTAFFLKNSKGQSLIPISVICGFLYTLYLVSNVENKRIELVLSSKRITSSFPVTLNIGNLIPIALYGNTEKAAAIDSKGWIIYISKPDDSSPNDFIEILKLPNNEKAVNVVCGENFIVALSMSNRIYISKDIKSKLFTPVEELRDIKICQISGSIHHCFALSQDGRVFVFGENLAGCIGSLIEFEYYSIFKEMLVLKQYNIVDVYAGFSHSLFRTLEGKIIACGNSSYGEIPINSQPYFRPNLPMETIISNGVTFCVAGNCTSLFFFGYDILRNPNRRVIDFSIDTSWLINNYNSNLKTDIFLHIERPKLERINTHTKLKIYSVNNIMKLTVHEILGYDLNSKIAKVSYHNKMYTQIIIDSLHSYPILDVNPDYINCVMMQFQNMCNTLNNLNNPSIIKVHGICFGDSTQPPCALLDYCPHDINYLFGKVNGFERVSCLYHLSLAMKDFHEHGIIHRNLKPECIFFDNNFNVKVTGFGITCFEGVSTQISLKSSANSVIFMAPELLKNKSYDEKVDVYSFGYLMYYILSEKRLPNISDAIKGKIQIYGINKIACQLIKSCLSQNPKKRPSFSEIVDYFIKHEFKLDDSVGTCPIRTE